MRGLSLVANPVDRSDSTGQSDVHAVMALLEGTFGGEPGRLSETLLSDLAYAATDLGRMDRERSVVRICGAREPWEVGLERSGAFVLVTVFRSGPLPQVTVHERRIPLAALGARVMAAIDASLDAGAPSRAPKSPAPTSRFAPPLLVAEAIAEAPVLSDALRFSRDTLASALPFAEGDAALPVEIVPVEPAAEGSVVISSELSLRARTQPAKVASVSRSDLFSLLFRGRVRVAIGEHEREIADVLVFLFVEQLVAMALEAVSAWTRGRAFYRRVQTGGAVCGIRLDPRGAASVTLGGARHAGGDRNETWTFPAVDVGELLQGIVAFGRTLCRTLVRRDRGQAQNLRLGALRTQLRELGERLREATRNDSKVNESPQTYRAFASTPPPPSVAGAGLGQARLRFSAKWLAAIPSIDLRSTFLCGEALIVGSAGLASCLHRSTGEMIWQREMPRAVSVMTPAGLARLAPDGSLSLHDLSTGEIAWSTELSPRTAGALSGAVIGAPGLPRMLIVAEGKRHLSAIDLDAGEPRWKHATRRGTTFRLRRAGKLVIVASGEPALVALDVVSGEVVWRFCDRLRFASHVAVDRDALFALAGHGALVDRGGSRLHHLDPWSGEGRWSRDLPVSITPVGAPLITRDAVVVAAMGREGTSLYGFDRKSGDPLFETVVCKTAASCMAVDDLVIVNSEGGELIGVDARTSEARYRHVFSNGADADRPRRLEPVLRSGALFVPQKDVHVVRPRDGTVIGCVEADLVPDLLRVDERCHVYVAEQSGHLAAFAAAPRLALVK